MNSWCTEGFKKELEMRGWLLHNFKDPKLVLLLVNLNSDEVEAPENTLNFPKQQQSLLAEFQS